MGPDLRLSRDGILMFFSSFHGFLDTGIEQYKNRTEKFKPSFRVSSSTPLTVIFDLSILLLIPQSMLSSGSFQQEPSILVDACDTGRQIFSLIAIELEDEGSQARNSESLCNQRPSDLCLFCYALVPNLVLNITNSAAKRHNLKCLGLGQSYQEVSPHLARHRKVASFAVANSKQLGII